MEGVGVGEKSALAWARINAPNASRHLPELNELFVTETSLAIKPSTYKIQIQRGNGWWLMAPVEIVLTHNRKLKVALVKTASVSGKVVRKQSKFIQEAPELEGIKILATSAQGDRFTAVTDAQGNFSLHLPAKPFTFSVVLYDGDQTASNPAQSIEIKEQGNPTIIFNLADGSRNVDIRQF